MTLQTALSGLLVAQTGLNTVSNDLANANSTAFKSQTSLFEDLYPEGSRNVPGIGAATEGISSDLTQGNVTATGNPLDAAIQGNGYFVVSASGGQQYTRDGAFQLSSTGMLQTLNGATVQGYAQTNGVPASTLSGITINTGSVPAKETSNLGLTLSLNSGDPIIPAGTAFNPADTTTYDETTQVVTYDSLGNANHVQLYFAQNPAAAAGDVPTWTVYAQPTLANGTAVGGVQTLGTALSFNSSGVLTGGSPQTLNVDWGNGAANSAIVLNFDGTTLGAQNFAVAGLTNDGYAPGNYSSTTIDTDGAIVSTYTNGQTVTAGTLTLANFINPEGLQPISGNLYAATQTSGVPVIDTPGNGQAGTISGGNLEQSNASTSALLVSLIQYQQAYQANTSVLQTEQQDSQRLVQI
jgi:flagellar hook protein FlgE